MKELVESRAAKSGFSRAAMWLLGFVWLGSVFGGMAISFSPSPYPKSLGWSLLAAASITLIMTTTIWVRALPGLLAYGLIGSVIEISSGHVLGHPEVRISPIVGVFLLFFFGISTGLSFSFSRRPIEVIDRIVLFLFIACCFAQVVAPREQLAILGFGFGCLFAGWGIQYFRKRGD